MLNIIKYLWQLPQHLLALLLLHIFDFSSVAEPDYFIQHDIPYLSAVSLGQYRLYFKARYVRNEKMRKHEAGHSKQSLYLGWFYLILIGLPSTIGNLLSRISPWLREHYYEQPWEKWADKLGGVVRDE